MKYIYYHIFMEIATTKAKATTRTGIPHTETHTPFNSTLNLAKVLMLEWLQKEINL